MLPYHKALMSSNKPTIRDIMGLIPVEELYKLNTNMQGPLWGDEGWKFEKQLQQ
jgi:hypothetical protein